MNDTPSRSQPGSGPAWKGTLGLAVALTVIASAAWWAEYSYKPAKDEEESQSKKVFRLKGVGVSELRIASGANRFTFQCLDKEKSLCKAGDGSKWQMTEPSGMRADDSNVNSFLSALANAQSSEAIELSDETDAKRAQLLKDYGLGTEERAKEDARRIEVTLLSGEKRTIRIGGNHPIGDQLFTLSSTEGDKKVFLLPSYFKSHFERDLQYWRNKKVLEIASSDVTAVQNAGTKSKWKAERKDGTWMLSATDAAKSEALAGDSESLESLLNAAGNLNARSFAAEDKDSAEGRKALQGTKVLATLSFASKDAKEPVVLTLHERAGAPAKAAAKAKSKTAPSDADKTKLYATVSIQKPVFEVDNAVRNRLDKPLSDLRLKRPLDSVSRLAATRLAFEGADLGTAPLELKYEGSKWELTAATPAGGATLDSEKVAKLLEKLAGRQIDGFVAGKDIPAGEGTGLRVYVGDEKEPRKQGFVFWKSADNHLYGRDLLSKRNEAWKLQSAMRAALPWTREALMLKMPTAAPAGAAAPAPTGMPVQGTPASKDVLAPGKKAG